MSGWQEDQPHSRLVHYNLHRVLRLVIYNRDPTLWYIGTFFCTTQLCSLVDSSKTIDALNMGWQRWQAAKVRPEVVKIS